jgi:hypothetical protein
MVLSARSTIGIDGIVGSRIGYILSLIDEDLKVLTNTQCYLGRPYDLLRTAIELLGSTPKELRDSSPFRNKQQQIDRKTDETDNGAEAPQRRYCLQHTL